MRLTRIIVLAAGLALASSATAQTPHLWSDPSGWWDAHFSYDVNSPKYTAQELSMDFFGSYINAERKFNQLFDTNIRHGFWGGGVGLNYFFTEYLGAGVDFNMSAKHDSNLPMVDQVVGDLVLRFPICNSGVAPYAIGSGGRQIGGGPVPWEWVYGGGVGLEYRWNPVTGIFTDARFFWGDKGTAFNRLLIRAGFKVVF